MVGIRLHGGLLQEFHSYNLAEGDIAAATSQPQVCSVRQCPNFHTCPVEATMLAELDIETPA
jgi:hypothetical protein